MREEPGRPIPTDYRDESDLDLASMARALARRKSWIALGTGACLLAALVFIFAVKPRYTADSQVLIENQENFFTRPSGATTDALQPPDDEAVASQLQLLTSRDLARKAISTLDLTHNPEFNPRASTGLLSRVEALIGLSRPSSALSEEDQILQTYYQKISVFQVAKSRVLQVEFSAQDPQLAARAANTIADLYIDAQISAKRDAARRDAASLGAQVADLQTKLNAAEDKAETFRAQHGLLMGPNNTTLSTQQLADLNTQLAAARTAQAEAQAKAKLIRTALAQGRLDEVSDIVNNDLIRQISVQRVTLRGQLALEARTLLPQHPRIKELQAQLSDVDNNLRNSAVTVARGLENDSKLAEARFESIQTTLDRQKQDVGDAGSNEVQMRSLDRDAKQISDQLQSSTTKYQEALARQTATSTPGDARVISRAIAPQLPSFPRKVPTLVFATVAGLVLSTAAALSAELLSGGTRPVAPRVIEPVADLEDKEAFEQERALPETDKVSAPPDDGALSTAAAAAETQNALARARARARASRGGDSVYALIAKAKSLSDGSGRAACVLVVGASKEAAAGQTAVDIARGVADEGRAILVELRKGLLPAAELSAPQDRAGGLSELLDGERSFSEAIHRDEASRLHFIVAGDSAVASGETLDVVIEALGETYDHVILLAAPVGADELALELSGSADLVALVAAGRGLEAQLVDARTRFVRAGTSGIMIVHPQSGPRGAEHVSAA